MRLQHNFDLAHIFAIRGKQKRGFKFFKIALETRLASAKWKEVKSTWRKDLITYNSHPKIMFPFNWLVIIWRGLEGEGGFVCNWTSKVMWWKNFCCSWTNGGRGVSKIEHFSWTSYVYCPKSHQQPLISTI